MPADLMPLQQENRAELLEILGAYGEPEEELARFLSWIRAHNWGEFESFDPDGKRVLLDRYLRESYGPKKFRTGKDG